jgi:hypothetical protein
MIEAFYRSHDVDREGRNSSVRLSVGPSAFMFRLSNTELYDKVSSDPVYPGLIEGAHDILRGI